MKVEIEQDYLDKLLRVEVAARADHDYCGHDCRDDELSPCRLELRNALKAIAPVKEWISGPGDAECFACQKVWRHHLRGEEGTRCSAHDYGPAVLNKSLKEPGVVAE